MKIEKIEEKLKFILIFAVLVFFVYISLVFHINRAGKNENLDDLYEGLKNVDKKEESYSALIKHGIKTGDYLAKRIAVENNDLVKIDVIQIIGITGCSSCAEGLVPFIKDPDWRIRFFAIDTLYKLKYGNISSLLEEIASDDTNNQVKIKAIMSLGKYGSEKDLIFLEELSRQREYKDIDLNKAINIALANLKSKTGTRSTNH